MKRLEQTADQSQPGVDFCLIPPPLHGKRRERWSGSSAPAYGQPPDANRASADSSSEVEANFVSNGQTITVKFDRLSPGGRA